MHSAHVLTRHFDKTASKVKTLFINTAAEVEKGGSKANWVNKDREGLEKAGFQISDYSVTNKSEAKIRESLRNIDFVFVNGGNTYYLLQQMQKCNFKNIIDDFLNNGGVYGGSSAGSIAAGLDISATKKIEHELYELESTRGLGLCNFDILPHWGSDSFKDLYLNHRLDHAYSHPNSLIMLNDQSYVVVDRDGRYKIWTIDD